MAAAVADFRPKDAADGKLKKDDGTPEIALEPTPDILRELGRAPQRPVLVGFAAETSDVEAAGRAKLARRAPTCSSPTRSAARAPGSARETNHAVIVSVNGDDVRSARLDQGASSPRPSSTGSWRALRRRRPRSLTRPDRRRLDSAHHEHEPTCSPPSPSPRAIPTSSPTRSPTRSWTPCSTEDPNGRVACETLVTTGLVFVCGEITLNKGWVDVPQIVRETITDVGYTDAKFGLDGETCGVMTSIQEQSPDIARGVDDALEQREEHSADELDQLGAGDQGMMFGFACRETEELMPLPIAMAHRLAKRLADVRKAGVVPYLRPDGKTQVSIAYEDGAPVAVDTVLISAQHREEVDVETLLAPDIDAEVIDPVLREFPELEPRGSVCSSTPPAGSRSADRRPTRG